MQTFILIGNRVIRSNIVEIRVVLCEVDFSHHSYKMVVYKKKVNGRKLWLRPSLSGARYYLRKKKLRSFYNCRIDNLLFENCSFQWPKNSDNPDNFTLAGSHLPLYSLQLRNVQLPTIHKSQ